MIRDRKKKNKLNSNSLAEQVLKKSSQRSQTKADTTVPNKYISSGSTLLNLALSDSAFAGFATGKVVNIIGDSSAGKTLLALTVLAEAANDERFNQYALIYDDAEAACEFDLLSLFGKELHSEILHPTTAGDGQHSETVQDFDRNITTAMKEGPCIYILDSLDSITSDEERARDNAESTKGSYKMEKPKLISELFRKRNALIEQSGSLLIIISQTRQDINPMTFTKKTRSGGDALRFYSTHEMWMAVTGKVKRHDRVVGIKARVRVTKNKLTGKLRDVDFPIYNDYGIDDITSCIDFLIDEGVFTMRKKTVVASALEFEGSKAKLVEHIETNKKTGALRVLCGRTWLEAENRAKTNRKRQYGKDRNTNQS